MNNESSIKSIIIYKEFVGALVFNVINEIMVDKYLKKSDNNGSSLFYFFIINYVITYFLLYTLYNKNKEYIPCFNIISNIFILKKNKKAKQIPAFIITYLISNIFSYIICKFILKIDFMTLKIIDINYYLTGIIYFICTFILIFYLKRNDSHYIIYPLINNILLLLSVITVENNKYTFGNIFHNLKSFKIILYYLTTITISVLSAYMLYSIIKLYDKELISEKNRIKNMKFNKEKEDNN